MTLRPPRSRIGDAVRISGTVLIAVHLFLSAWLVIQFEGQYTEGQPAPTNVKALVAIDKEQTLIDVEMENATSFLLYMLFRDYEEPTNSSQQDAQDSADDGTSSSTKEENAEPVEWLKIGRNATLFSLLFMCIAEGLVLAGIPFRATVRAFGLTFAAACFLILMPASYVLDLAGDDDGEEAEGDETIADETFVAQTEQGSMAHEETSIERTFLPTGVRFEMMFNGYDLGLVEPENYSTVRNQPPAANDTDAQSFVQFESVLDLKYGKNLPSLFFIPLLWYFFPAKPRTPEQVSSEQE